MGSEMCIRDRGISDAVNAVEARIRDVEPLAKIIYLEPASKIDVIAEGIE